jgi:hypothetical protein
VVKLFDAGLKCEDGKYYVLVYLDGFVIWYSKLIAGQTEGRDIR